MERETHILVLPYALQGHINPMPQFSKRLASKGPRVTFLTTTISASNSIQLAKAKASSFNIKSISDGSEKRKELESADAYFKRFKVIVSLNLAKFIEKQKSSNYPPNILVYDSVIPWALDIARQHGIQGASFFTQSCVVNAIYFHHSHKGGIRLPLEGPTVISLPSMPSLEINDLPTFFHDDADPALFKILVNQFSNLREANWLLCNTFDNLEQEVVNWMTSQWPIKTIGPTIPSIYTDKRLEDDKEYGLSLFNPNADACMKWLDMKENSSVVYASFGSVSSLGEEQMEEVALGLINTKFYFLWVVRETDVKKLPINFEEETREKGLIVNWCPQLEVLDHKAIGCFMTHCGWNSTLEALSLGVPLVAMPQRTDQPTNAKFITYVWKVGVWVKLDEKGIVAKEEIERCLREVMEGESGKEMKKNSIRWKELAKEAVDEGGSSDKNIEEFVTELALA